MKRPPPTTGAPPAPAPPDPSQSRGSTFCPCRSVCTRVPGSSPSPQDQSPLLLPLTGDRQKPLAGHPVQSPKASPQTVAHSEHGQDTKFAAQSQGAEFKRHRLRQPGVQRPQPHWCGRGQLRLASLHHPASRCTDISIRGICNLYTGLRKPPCTRKCQPTPDKSK